MHNLKQIIFIILVFIGSIAISSAVAVYADTAGMTAHYDENSETVEITGNIGIALKNEQVLLLVLKPGKDLNNIKMDGKTSSNDAVNYCMNVSTDEGGNFAYTYKVQGNSGKYIVIAGNKQMKVPLKAEFIHYSVVEREQAFQDILHEREKNNSESQGNIGKILNEKYVALRIDFSLFLSVADKNIIYSAIMAEPTMEDIEDLIRIVKEYSVVEAFNEAAVDTDISVLMRDYAEILDLEDTLYAGDMISDKGKLSIRKALLDMPHFENIAQIRDTFLEASIVTAISDVKSWLDIRKIITDYGDAVGINLNEYNKLSKSKKDNVDKSIADMDFSSAQGLKDAFNEQVAEQDESKGSGTGRGSSKGNSGTVGMNLVLSNKTEVPAQSNPDMEVKFNDLGGVEWAVESIKKLAQRGIIVGTVNGKGKNEFRPNDYITREEFTKLIVLAFNAREQNAQCSFSDVKLEDWYYEYVASATQLGLVKGVGDGLFGTGSRITRQDMAVLIYRAAQYSDTHIDGKTDEVNFEDTDNISEYAVEAVNMMKNAGIIAGMEDGKFLPNEFATRAQAAKVIASVLDKQ